jgi:hypothetical protein
MWFNPKAEIERLKLEFQESRARIWKDPNMPLEKKNPLVDQLWREFDQQRRELQSGSQDTAEEPSPQRSHAPFLPRRRRPSWK